MSKPRARDPKGKQRLKPLIEIVLGLSVLLAIGIVAVTHMPSNGGNSAKCYDHVPGPSIVSLCLGDSFYKYINLDIDNISRASADRLLEYINCSDRTCIVLFGVSTCPHCEAMNQFFTSSPKYRDIYMAFWVDRSENTAALFYYLYIIERENGIEDSIALNVPQMLIIRNGSPSFIVIGENRSEDFWDRLVGLS